MAKARKKPTRKAKPKTRGLTPAETRLEAPGDLKARIEEGGGVVIGAFADPLGNNPLIFAVLPIDEVEPTPFQRDLSQAHHRKLAGVLEKTGMFLDPVICVTAPEKGFWTPNGRHRLEAMRRLGARAITALVVPKREIAWQILALNTEKAHNLREKSLEVIRIYRGLIEQDDSRAESTFAFYLEEASLATMGICYERNPKFAGGAYNPTVRRLTEFSDDSIAKSLKRHEKTADLLMDLDEKVGAVVAKLKARGFVSPYLRTFVVSRINPLRFMKTLPELDEHLRSMRDRAAKFNTEKVKQQDLANMAGAAEDGD
jgi:ParB family transcriptional regulator, chromosome partitioning protein